jgi:hypothetical protein
MTCLMIGSAILVNVRRIRKHQANTENKTAQSPASIFSLWQSVVTQLFSITWVPTFRRVFAVQSLMSTAVFNPRLLLLSNTLVLTGYSV